ncbi:C2 family cysteine protease [Cellulomonas soli]
MSEIPGSAAGLREIAGTLSARAGAVRAGRDDVLAARRCEWTGTAADAFRAWTDARASELDDLDATLRRGAAVLFQHADVLEECEARAATARTRWDDARHRLQRLDATALVDALQAGRDHRSALADAQRSADAAADALADLTGGDRADDGWWDPFGWGDDDDESEPTRKVDESLLDDASFDDALVQQGGMGDCYLLATLMGVMRTDGGDDLLRRNVRWDEGRKAYAVTLYVNGEPVEYYVDKVFDDGASDFEDGWWFFDGSTPNVASLYEAALAQHLGYADLSDGGVPAEAIELITGVPGVEYQGTSQGYTAVWDEITTAVGAGDPVVASTRENWSGDDGDWTVEATRRDADGSTRTVQVELPDNHAYSVVEVEPDGSAWVRNPWGPNHPDGGEFLLSAEDFADIFYRVSVPGSDAGSGR